MWEGMATYLSLFEKDGYALSIWEGIATYLTFYLGGVAICLFSIGRDLFLYLEGMATFLFLYVGGDGHLSIFICGRGWPPIFII